MKTTNIQAAGWAAAHLPVLSHDTVQCIMRQGLVAQSWAWFGWRTGSRYNGKLYRDIADKACNWAVG